MKTRLLILLLIVLFSVQTNGQTLSEKQMINARATGYAIVAARNPGVSFSVLMIPWDGVNSLEYNANHLINPYWHAQAAVKGNYFSQTFDGSDFSVYSTVVLSQSEFDQYKSAGTQWWIVCSTLSPFSRSISTSSNGNIGIGTTTPEAKLTVKGKIVASEIQVKDVGAIPDYVFKPDYELMPLNHVEEFVKQNQHLPEVPSEKEFQRDGMNMAEMNVLLLKKIEELTLYAIKQNKKAEEQALYSIEQNNSLKEQAKKIDALEKAMNNLNSK